MKLHSNQLGKGSGEPVVGRITENSNYPSVLRGREILLLKDESVFDGTGFAAVLARPNVPIGSGVMALPPELNYLKDGDVVRLNPTRGEVRVLYRLGSHHNAFLVTEQCNSKCLMCSQPPRDIDDRYHLDEILKAIPLVGRGTEQICFTGGEPTLFGNGFLELVRAAKHNLPTTALQILTNGRSFRYLKFAEAFAEINHPRVTLCIPLYSDIASRHDFVVQAEGAFDETVLGIMNLARLKQRIEIRFVIHKQTYERLPQSARFFARNFPFVDHVALMGLEMMGYTKTNLEALWIDPIEYQRELTQAVEELKTAGMYFSIYNHQLCLLPEQLWRFARKSISDWKNVYMPECNGCSKQNECGGFFASADLRYSNNIRAFL